MEPLADDLDRATQYEYSGSCVSRPELVQGLARWIKRGGALPADLTVRVLGHDVPEFWAKLEIRRGGRTVAVREFSSPAVACPQRGAVLSSALGLALENYLEQARASEPLRATRPGPESGSPSQAPAWRVETYAGGFWGVGLLPEATWSAGMGAGFARSSWVARGGAFLTPTQVFRLGEGQTHAQLLGTELLGCFSQPVGSRPLELCAEGRLGFVRLSGAHYEVSLSTREPYASVGLSLTLTEPFGRVAFYLGGRAGFTVWAPELVVRSEQDLALVASRAWPGFSAGVLTGLRFDLSRPGPKDSGGAAIDP